MSSHFSTIFLVLCFIVSSECLLVDRVKRSNSLQLHKRSVRAAAPPKLGGLPKETQCGFGAADVLEVEPVSYEQTSVREDKGNLVPVFPISDSKS